MIMPGIEREQFFAGDSIPQIKLMRTSDVTFRTDTEELRFDGIIKLNFAGSDDFENSVERGSKPLPGRMTIRRRIFVAIRNPNIGDAGFAQGLAERRANVAANNPVFDPELTNAFVRMRQREAVRCFGMRKERGIKIQAQPLLLCPANPVREMFRPRSSFRSTLLPFVSA